MKIITISAKARHGKDFTADLIKDRLEKNENKVLITHYADLLKYICSTFFAWDGKKDNAGRTLLQHVGTEIIRKQQPDYWVNFLTSIFNLFPKTWDYIIIPDTRFPNENSKLKESGFDVTTVRVDRPNFDNGLTEEQKSHESETALDNYNFDFLLINNGDETINSEIDRFIDYINLRGNIA